MSEIYNQVYKCRLCGAEFRIHTSSGKDKTVALMENFLDRANERTNQVMYFAPCKYYQHWCKNGDFGVADFMGYKKENVNG